MITRLPMIVLPAIKAPAAGAIFSGHAVVREVAEVVEFVARADLRVANRAAINRAIGTDLNVIPDLHTTELRHLMESRVVAHITKTITADDGATVHHYAGTNGHAVIKHDIGKDDAIRRQLTTIANRNAGHQHRTPPDSRTADHDVRADHQRLLQHSFRVHHRGFVHRVDYRAWQRMKVQRHLGKGQPNVGDQNLRGPRLKVDRRDQGTRTRQLGRVPILHIAHEADVLWTSRTKVRHATNGERPVADNATFNKAG